MRGWVLGALLLLGCPSSAPAPEQPATPDVGAVCCAQCEKAASQDPQAMDLTLVPCRSYAGRVVNGSPVLDATCTTWFATRDDTVGACVP